MTPSRALVPATLLALAALLAPLALASHQPGPPFGLAVEAGTREVTAGEVAVVNVTVTNRGPHAILARLDASEEWQDNASLRLAANVTPASALLEAGASLPFRVEVRTTEATMGHRWFRVNATSPDDAGASNSTTFSLWVAPAWSAPSFTMPPPSDPPAFGQAPTPRGPWDPTGTYAFNASLVTPEVTLRWPYAFEGVQVRVENAGDRATLVASVEDLTGRLRLDPDATGRTDLFPGMEVQTTVLLRATDPEPGQHRVLVRLHLEEDPAQTTTFEAIVHVEARPAMDVPDLAMTGDVRVSGPDAPVPVAPGRASQVAYAFTNVGNRTLRLTMESGAVHRNLSGEMAPEPAAGWNASWDRMAFTLLPDATVTTTLTLRASADAAPGERYWAYHWVLVNESGPSIGMPGMTDVRVVEPDDPALLAAMETRDEPASASPGGEGASGGVARVLFAQPLALAGLGVGAGALVAARLLRRESWRYGLLAATVPLYTRLSKGRMLEHEAREGIHRLVAENPGVHYSALKERTGLNTGALVHHLRALERSGYLVSRREGTLRRFYAPGAAPVPPAPTVPTTPVQERVLSLLDERPMTQRELADRLGLTQQGVSYHVKTLERKGLLVVREQGGVHRCHRVRAFTAVER